MSVSAVVVFLLDDAWCMWQDISLCTHTHNNESAKLGHHNSCNSFPRESTTIAWRSGIYLKHCISCLAHYSFVMAALRRTVSLPLHYGFALKCTALCVKCMSSVRAYELVCSPVPHLWPDCIFTMGVPVLCISELQIKSIDFAIVCLLIDQATFGQPIIHSEDHTIYHVSTPSCVS